MPMDLEPVNVRTARLNNLIVGKGKFGVSVAPNIRRRTNNPQPKSTGAALQTTIPVDVLSREGLLDALCVLYDECDNETLKKSHRNISDFVRRYSPVIKETRAMRVNLNDFSLKSLIGTGHYGEVHLVVERQTNDIYAMKKMLKSNVNSVMAKVERDIMALHSCEWIVYLQYAFQDVDHLYLVMEYMPGGDLLALMMRIGSFDEDITRFYLAELTMAIHAVHALGYVHRDIKPENVLFDFFGHIKLGDFGNAAVLDRDGHVSSFHPVGTPDYIAPELLETLSTYKPNISVHSVSCDFWSMGIIGYELICEVTPFHEENVHETYSKILCHCEDSPYNEFISFPSDMKVSENFKNLIQRLVTNPSRRLDYDQIRKHPFFEKIQWELIRSHVPPFIPSIKDAFDTTNFEITQLSGHHARRRMSPRNSGTLIKSSGFSGKDLPFVGYGFVRDAGQNITDDVNDMQLSKLNEKMKEMQSQLKVRSDEIGKLKQELLRADELVKNSGSQKQLLEEAKDDIKRMKSLLKEKNGDLATCKTQIKTLENAMRIEAEMWQKKEDTITEVLRLNRQKYEEAKIATEQRYEQMIAEKVYEVSSLSQKMEARETELRIKTEECKHLDEKLDNYKDMLRQLKEKAEKEKEEYEEHNIRLTAMYDERINELNEKLRLENNSVTRLSTELRGVRNELDDCQKTSSAAKQTKESIVKANNEILKRLNEELHENNELRSLNIQLEQKLVKSEKSVQQLTSEVERLKRDIEVYECSKKLNEASLTSPYQTAPGSMNDLRNEDQLRADLEAAQEQVNIERDRVESLQCAVIKLEQIAQQFQEQNNASPTKPSPAPRPRNANGNGNGGDGVASKPNDPIVVERRERADDDFEKLQTLREQVAFERKESRKALLGMYKAEKQLEEVLAENKLTKRRLELTADRMKMVKSERDEAKGMCAQIEQKVVQRDEQIKALNKQIDKLKSEVAQEHKKWETSEKKRMESKNEVRDHINKINRLESTIQELRQKSSQVRQKYESFEEQNAALVHDLDAQRQKLMSMEKCKFDLECALKRLQEQYEHLKLACTITDAQFTEMEGMLETERTFNEEQKERIRQLLHTIDEKDEELAVGRRELGDKKSEISASEARIALLNGEIQDQKQTIESIQKKNVSQQNHLLDVSTKLFESQEHIDVLNHEIAELQARIKNNEREIDIFRTENTRILTDLFHAKEEIQCQQEKLNATNEALEDTQHKLDKITAELNEKDHHYKQREIKFDATLAQHKKLIDYLQLTIQDLSAHKKKTLADRLFGTSKKENIPPGIVENTIVYRTLDEELRREKQLTKALKDKITKLEHDRRHLLTQTDNDAAVERNGAEEQSQGQSQNHNPNQVEGQSQANESDQTGKVVTNAVLHIRNPETQSYHRFELALQETNIGAAECVVCHKPILANTGYWKCRECGNGTHRNCREKVTVACGTTTPISGKAGEANSDTDSLGKFSYTPNIYDNDNNGDHHHHPHAENEKNAGAQCTDNACPLPPPLRLYDSTLIYSVKDTESQSISVVNCAYEIESEQIVLLGCNKGLYALHLRRDVGELGAGNLVHIGGIESVNGIEVSQPLSKVLFIGSEGKSLYQCDYRILQSRSHANAALKPALEVTQLDIPVANRDTDSWQILKISNWTEHENDPIAIVATSSRMILLKFDFTAQKFKPVRSMDTSTPITAVLFTRYTIIVSSDKFYEIDLSTYMAEEFLDIADMTLAHLPKCQPIVAIFISKHEFLLCFAECGIFVDEFGCRSRPYDLNWEYTPTGFLYSEPYLYISHFQSIQVIRLHRSYAKDYEATEMKDNDDTNGNRMPNFKRLLLPFYMPSLLVKSGKHNMYVTAVQKQTGLQDVYHIDVVRLFKQKYDSLESVSSIGTSITLTPSET